MKKTYLAHVKQDEKGNWDIHKIDDHLREVGRIASEMAKAFNGSEWAQLAGLWHDMGKFRPAFQGYIKKESGYDTEAHIEQVPGKVDHSTVGAVHAVEFDRGAGRLLAYLIAGHHAGLPDWFGGDSGATALENRLDNASKKGYLAEALQANIPLDILNPALSLNKPLGGSEGLHLWLRMLFSCLVDADFLDTEKFMNPVKAEARQASWSFPNLKNQFDTYMADIAKTSEATIVNKWRKSILQDCRKAGHNLPGIYTLTVPTGGGKTLSGMAFALEHAVKHNKQRIIVAIPYTINPAIKNI